MNAQPEKPSSIDAYRILAGITQPDMPEHETLKIAGPALTNLLNFSPCVTWILDLRTQKFHFISNNTAEFFGFDLHHYEKHGYLFHESNIEPNDILNTWTLLHKVWKALVNVPVSSRAHYKFSHDYRIVKPDGKMMRILEQNAVLQQDANGNVTHLLGICSDITPWKTTGTQLASLSSEVDQQYFLFTAENTTIVKPKAKGILSKRELEIVKMISEGHSSKFIADKLFISFHTVNTHRQKMMEKTNTKNTGGLIQFAACNGLI